MKAVICLANVNSSCVGSVALLHTGWYAQPFMLLVLMLLVLALLVLMGLLKM